MDELKKTLLMNAKRSAVAEAFGEFIESKSQVEMGLLTKDSISAKTLGLIRVKGTPRFFNGDNFGEVCTEIDAYVTKEDIKKFQFQEVRLKGYCYGNRSIPIGEIKGKARQSSFLEIIKKSNPSLTDISMKDAQRLVHNYQIEKEDIDLNTGLYCMDIRASIVPIELENYEALKQANEAHRGITGSEQKDTTIVQGLEAKEIKRYGSFIHYNDGIIVDQATGLMWADTDNGINTNWIGAKAYCRNYRGRGYDDWRMPTITELQEIYDPHNDVFKFSINDAEVWAADTKGGYAIYLDISTGFPDKEKPAYSKKNRALPVRNLK